MTSLGFRDPWRTFVGDVWEDPLMSTVGTFPATTSGRVRTGAGVVNRLICMDAFENDQEFCVIVECPGVPKEKLDVNVDGHLLTIRCTKQAPDYSNTYNMMRNELTYGTETRSIRIPTNCSSDPSMCQYKDGCLCIHFPKSGETEGKKLQIQEN